jgi:hypothetical protein
LKKVQKAVTIAQSQRRLVIENNQNGLSVVKETPSDNDMKDILNALKKQKESISLMRVTIDDNSRQMMVMNRELNS